MTTSTLLDATLVHLQALVSFDTRNPPRAIGTDGIFGYLRENLTLMLLVILASIAGTLIGGRILPKVSYEFFRRIILVAVLGLGISMTVGII